MRELLRLLPGLLDGIMSRFVLKRVYTPETQLSHTAENITTRGREYIRMTVDYI